MMKSMKKQLKKFWPKKKKKKRTHYSDQYPHPPPSSTSHHCCSCSSSWVQPSAPPLPPWLDTQQTHDANMVPPEIQPGLSFLASSSETTVFPAQDIVMETPSVYPAKTTSYQQYMVPNPVYGVPVVPTVRREESVGVFGRVAEIGIYLICCFCPWFSCSASSLK